MTFFIALFFAVYVSPVFFCFGLEKFATASLSSTPLTEDEGGDGTAPTTPPSPAFAAGEPAIQV